MQVKVKDSPSVTAPDPAIEIPSWMEFIWMLEGDMNSWVLGQEFDE